MDEITVNDGHDSNWVYNQMEITSGQLFHDKKHLQHAIKKWSFLEKKTIHGGRFQSDHL